MRPPALTISSCGIGGTSAAAPLGAVRRRKGVNRAPAPACFDVGSRDVISSESPPPGTPFARTKTPAEAGASLKTRRRGNVRERVGSREAGSCHLPRELQGSWDGLPLSSDWPCAPDTWRGEKSPRRSGGQVNGSSGRFEYRAGSRLGSDPASGLWELPQPSLGAERNRHRAPAFRVAGADIATERHRLAAASLEGEWTRETFHLDAPGGGGNAARRLCFH